MVCAPLGAGPRSRLSGRFLVGKVENSFDKSKYLESSAVTDGAIYSSLIRVRMQAALHAHTSSFARKRSGEHAHHTLGRHAARRGVRDGGGSTVAMRAGTVQCSSRGVACA